MTRRSLRGALTARRRIEACLVVRQAEPYRDTAHRLLIDVDSAESNHTRWSDRSSVSSLLPTGAVGPTGAPAPDLDRQLSGSRQSASGTPGSHQTIVPPDDRNVGSLTGANT